MINIKEFPEIAVPPSNPDAAWLERAESAVDHFVSNRCVGEIILLGNVGQTQINAVLVSQTNLTSEAIEQLEYAHIDPMAQ